MFEVWLDGNRWAWRMICAAGRTLVYTEDRYESDFEAAEAAKAYRRSFWQVADQTDHRMARAI